MADEEGARAMIEQIDRVWKQPKAMLISLCDEHNETGLKHFALGATGCLFDKNNGDIDAMIAEWREVFQFGMKLIETRDRLESKR